MKEAILKALRRRDIFIKGLYMLYAAGVLALIFTKILKHL
jgi:hypothetical protein